MIQARFWPKLAAFFSACALTFSAYVSATDAAIGTDAVWISAGNEIVRSDPSGGGSAFDAGHIVHAMAVDERDLSLWAYAEGMLSAFDFNGARLRSVEVPTWEAGEDKKHSHASDPCAVTVPQGKSPPSRSRITTDSRHGEIWVLEPGTLYRVGATGKILLETPSQATAISLDESDSTLWTVECGIVNKIDRNGNFITRLETLAKLGTIQDLDADAGRGLLWVTGTRGSAVLTSSGSLITSFDSSSQKIRSSINGTAWTAGPRELRNIDSTGRTLHVIDIRDLDISTIDKIATHPKDGSVWIASAGRLIRVNANGTSRKHPIPPLDTAVTSTLALYSDTIPPDLSLEGENVGVGFYPDITDGLERAESF